LIVRIADGKERHMPTILFCLLDVRPCIHTNPRDVTAISG
jgi:hypothetical protein